MTTKIYRVPFASDGEKQEIPVDIDVEGKVSDVAGFTARYEAERSAEDYLPIERKEMNGILHEITTALGEVQQFGFARWQPGTWQAGSRVDHGGVFYKALVETTQEPPHADWVKEIPDMPSVQDAMQPAFTGTMATSGPNNSIAPQGLAPALLGLEVGDVIRLSYPGYNKLHTVESIAMSGVNIGTIQVNKEHASSRADGPLKLQDKTNTQMTIVRIAKWYNAPIGLGQDWVNCYAPDKEIRSHAGVFQNNTNRAVSVAFAQSFPGETASVTGLVIDGIPFATRQYRKSQTDLRYFTIPIGAEYKAYNDNIKCTIQLWYELR